MTRCRQSGLRGFAMYHKALALALVGDFEGADAILSGERRAPSTHPRGAMAQAEILVSAGAQRGRACRARRRVRRALDPELAAIGRLSAGEPLPFTHVTSVHDGMAEVFFPSARRLRRSDAMIIR